MEGNEKFYRHSSGVNSPKEIGSTGQPQGDTKAILQDQSRPCCPHRKPTRLLPNEEARLRELYRYKILHTPEDPVFDDLARLAAQVCETPIAVISFMDRDRQWFKSRVGLAASEYPRRNTFCAQTIREDDLLVVPNPTKDERFARSCAVVGDEQARFYAGAPLRVPSGHVLGTLCVVDRRPRTLKPHQREGLRALARQVVAQLELRRTHQRTRTRGGGARADASRPARERATVPGVHEQQPGAGVYQG